MFTGIVEAVARVAAAEPLGAKHAEVARDADEASNALPEEPEGGRRLTFDVPFAEELDVGDSVAVNGACLTAVAADAEAGAFAVEAVEETLRKTNLGALREGHAANVERALRAGARLDGHFVQGHVDTTGRVASVEKEETGRLYEIRFDPALARYLIPTGSVALDGVSLTVARLDRDAGALRVAIVPHTYEATAIAERWAEGAAVNIEFDLIGKYALAQAAGTSDAGAQPSEPTRGPLR